MGLRSDGGGNYSDSRERDNSFSESLH